jgi:hypothetical protein
MYFISALVLGFFFFLSLPFALREVEFLAETRADRLADDMLQEEPKPSYDTVVQNWSFPSQTK